MSKTKPTNTELILEIERLNPSIAGRHLFRLEKRRLLQILQKLRTKDGTRS